MIHLDLFSGIGGFSLAAQWVWGEEHDPIFCEIDEFCQKVLSKHWPTAKIFSDIKELTYEQIMADTECTRTVRQGKNKEDGRNGKEIFADRIQTAERVGVGGNSYIKRKQQTTDPKPTIDLLTGGFPCQPFSVAGKRQGEADDRYLWPEMLRIISEVKPRWIIGENVTGILNMGFDDMLADLEAEGYETETLVLPACAVGARHRRDRVWIVANANNSGSGQNRCSGQLRTGGTKQSSLAQGVSQKGKIEQIKEGRKDVGYSPKPGFQNGANGTMGESRTEPEPKRSDWWTVEPDVGRVAHGIPRRVDRLKGLGNAIVPQIAQVIMRAIKQINGEKDR